MDGQHPHSGELKRGLKNRHIQLIALGGAIGTGLFLGSAGVLKSAGPSMILGYAIAGFIAFMIMRQLGEMIVEEPVAGSFSHFAHKYWGGFAGFLSGWNYWVLYILAVIRCWLPRSPRAFEMAPSQVSFVCSPGCIPVPPGSRVQRSRRTLSGAGCLRRPLRSSHRNPRRDHR